MNLVLFEPQDLGAPLARTDRRAQHVLGVLRRQVGGTFDAGVINGPVGKATITRVTETTVEFAFTPVKEAAPAARITLIVGLPRPQTARDILRDATTLGVAAIHFVRTDKGEGSYEQSTLWSSGEWRRHVITGAEQAFDTRAPEVVVGKALREVIAQLGSDAGRAGDVRLALDNYESSEALSKVSLAPNASVALAIGSERGWSTSEREQLRQSGFRLVHLGTRVLRTETAVTAALALVRAKLGLM